MRNESTFSRHRLAAGALFAGLLCLAAMSMLTANAPAAHALFTCEVRAETSHAVKAFPIELTVDASEYLARSKEVDRGQMTVTALFSDGTTRELDATEYELSNEEIPAGYKGAFEAGVTYKEAGHEVSSALDLDVDEAYGAQYGDTLVFGRGIPADAYEGKALTNTTWGFEHAAMGNLWNGSSLVSVVDIDAVSPLGMAAWFANCKSLRTVALDQMDTSRVTSLASLFDSDTNLTTVTGLETWNTANVTNMYHTFNYCHALTAANVASWNTSKVTTMRGMFDKCRTLTALDLSRWNVSNVTDMCFMFSMQDVTSRLTSVGNLAGWNTSNLREMEQMFGYNDALTTVGDISGWNTSRVTNMVAVFRECPLLKNVNCVRWNTSSVTKRWDFDLSSSGVIAPVW